MNGASASAIGQSATQAQVLPQPVGVETDAERAELACAALVDSPFNQARKVPGVMFEKIEPVRALSVCEAAKRLNPNSPSVSYLYARALEANHRDKEALPFLKFAGDHGSVAGNYEYGYILLGDTAGPHDYVTANRLFALVGDGGDPRGWDALADDYSNGHGFAKDPQAAVRLWQRAAEQGLVESQYELGLSYYTGIGVPKDYARSVLWLRKATDQDYPQAQFGLGFMYKNGLGTAKDPVMARQLFERGAALNSPESMVEVAQLLHSPKAPAADVARARSLFARAAAQGNVFGMDGAAEMYLNAERGPRDPVAAVAVLQQAAKTGDVWAMRTLGGCYRRGDGTTWNETLAMQWFRKAADRNDADAQSELGRGYANGLGNDPKDVAMAAHWFQQAANHGSASAQLQLGYLYEKGWGVPNDPRQAQVLYDKAAASPDPAIHEAIRKMNAERQQSGQGGLTGGEVLALIGAAAVVGLALAAADDSHGSGSSNPPSSVGSNPGSTRQYKCHQEGKTVWVPNVPVVGSANSAANYGGSNRYVENTVCGYE